MNALRVGDRFVAEIPGISQAQVNLFGALMGTDGPIHTDPEFARSTWFKGTVVPGILVAAPISDMMASLVGADRWNRAGKLEIKFVSFTRPGDEVSVSVEVTEAAAEAVHMRIVIANRSEVAVAVGEAVVADRPQDP